MVEPVQIEVKSDLRKIIADLETLATKADGVGEHLQRAGDETEKNLGRNTKDVETMLERVRDLGRRMADQIRGYFSDLAGHATHALEDARKDLGLKQQFIDATKEAISFNSVLHRIGTTIGVNADQMSEFQRRATKAFSDLGLGEAAAANALQGVSQTQVRGEGNILKTATTSAELAEIGGEKGNEGGIAKALAEALQAQGKNPNDMKAMEDLAENSRRNYNNTGQRPSEYLAHTASMFGGMSAEDRRKMTGDGMRNLSAVGAIVGPGFDSLVKEMTKGHLEKLPLEAQGFGGLVGKGGLDFDRMQRLKGIGKRIGGDQEAAFQTTGLSSDAAKALVKLIEMADQAKAAQAKAGTDLAGGPKSIEEQDKASKGLPENYETAKNRVKGVIASAEAPIIETANKVVGTAAGSKVGSAMLLGGGFLAATAAKFGVGKLSKMLGKKGGMLGEAGDAADAMSKAATVEQITGQKTMPVYVVNVAEIATAIGSTNGLPGAAGGDLAGAAGKAGGTLQKLGKGAAVAGTAIALYEAADAATARHSDKLGVDGGGLTLGIAEVVDKVTGGSREKANAQARETEKQLAAKRAEILAHQAEQKKNREQKNRRLLDSSAGAQRRGPQVGAPNR